MDNRIKADRLTQHHKYYLEKAGLIGIGWNDEDEKFMGFSLDYWKKKYKEDEFLNTHSLHSFDEYYPWHKIGAIREKISWTLSDTVCTLKAVIREKILKSEQKA